MMMIMMELHSLAVISEKK